MCDYFKTTVYVGDTIEYLKCIITCHTSSLKTEPRKVAHATSKQDLCTNAGIVEMFLHDNFNLPIETMYNFECDRIYRESLEILNSILTQFLFSSN